MTRKDFELIAATIRNVVARPDNPEMSDDWNRGYEYAAQQVCIDFSMRLAAANPRFNRVKFLRACGVEP